MDEHPQKNRKFLKVILFPLIILHKGVDKLLSKLFGKANFGDEITQDDIISMVDAGNESGNVEGESAEMINNIFEFGDMVVSDVMTHRTNIVGVEINDPLEDIVYIALEKGFSRIPVYEESIDAVIGTVIVKDLLCLIGNDNISKLGIKDFLREAVYVPESGKCSEAFKTLTSLKSGMGIVIDEYGGTAGIITLEDLIESIMGNIEDEYDDEEDEIKRLSEGAYELDGEADPEEALELFGYSLPEDHEYETIAGFVTDLLGYIPKEDEPLPSIEYKDIIFKVSEIDNNCIEKLVVYPNKGKSEKPAEELNKSVKNGQ